MSTKELTEKQDAMRAAAHYEVMQAIDKIHPAVIELVASQLIRDNSSQELRDKYEVAYPQRHICTTYSQLDIVLYENAHRKNPLEFIEYNEEELRKLYRTKHSPNEAVLVEVIRDEFWPHTITIIDCDIDMWMARKLAEEYLRIVVFAE